MVLCQRDRTWDNIFLSPFSEGCLSFRALASNVTIHTVEHFQSTRVTDFTVQNSLQCHEHRLMSHRGCCVEITPRTMTAMDTFYRLTCVKQFPLTVPPLSFINIRIGGGDEPMRAAPRGCLLWEQHLQLCKYHQQPTCIHTHTHAESHSQCTVPYTCIIRT